jgi:hypothetical protein
MSVKNTRTSRNNEKKQGGLGLLSLIVNEMVRPVNIGARQV